MHNRIVEYYLQIMHNAATAHYVISRQVCAKKGTCMEKYKAHDEKLKTFPSKARNRL